MTHCPRCGKDNPAEIHTCTPRALVLAEDLKLNHTYCPEEVLLEAAAELRRQHQVIESFEQSVTDPENQPSQYGTVPLEWYLRHEALLRQARTAMQAAKQYHGVVLSSDPPQDAWKAHSVDDKLSAAINAIKERLA